jgi:hypothetical protein
VLIHKGYYGSPALTKGGVFLYIQIMDTKDKEAAKAQNEETVEETQKVKTTEETKPTIEDFPKAEEILPDELEIDDLPGVSENAVKAQLEKEKSESTIDIDGEHFDPDIHATDKNGKPVKNKNGTWRKKRGRTAGKSTKKSSKEIEEQRKLEESYKASGIMCATVQELGMTAVFGDAGKFESIAQSKHTADVWESYLRSKEVSELPPSVMVVACVVSHGVRAAQKPEAQPRVESMKEKAGVLFNRIKKRFKRKKKTQEQELEEVIENTEKGEK